MNTDSQEILQPKVRLIAIIVASLIFGILIYAGVVLFVLRDLVPPQPSFEIITYLALGMLLVAIALQFQLEFVDRPIREQLRNETRLGRWADAYMGRTIIGCAILEGAGFMCLMGATLDGQPWGLIAGLASAAFMGVWYWPSAAKIQEYIERQKQKIADSASPLD